MNRLLKNIVYALVGIVLILVLIAYTEHGIDYLRPVFDRRVMGVQDLIDHEGLVFEYVEFWGDWAGLYRHAHLQIEDTAQKEKIDRLMIELGKLELRHSHPSEGERLFTVELWGEIEGRPGYSVVDLTFYDDERVEFCWSTAEDSMEDHWYRLVAPIDRQAIVDCFAEDWFEDFLGSQMQIEEVRGATLQGVHPVMSKYGKIDYYEQKGQLADIEAFEEWLETQTVICDFQGDYRDDPYYLLTLDCIRNGKAEILEIGLWNNQLCFDGCIYGIEYNLHNFTERFTGWTLVS